MLVSIDMISRVKEKVLVSIDMISRVKEKVLVSIDMFVWENGEKRNYMLFSLKVSENSTSN